MSTVHPRSISRFASPAFLPTWSSSSNKTHDDLKTHGSVPGLGDIYSLTCFSVCVCLRDSLSLSISSLSLAHSPCLPPSLHPSIPLPLPLSLSLARSLARSDSPTLCFSHEAATHGRNSSRQSPKTGNGRYLSSLASMVVLLFIFLILDCTTLRIWSAKHSTRWAWSGRSAFLVVQNTHYA